MKTVRAFLLGVLVAPLLAASAAIALPLSGHPSPLSLAQIVSALGFTPANKAGDTFTGTLGLKGLTETFAAPAISAGTLTIDLSAATAFNVASNANITTFTISNATASKVNSFTLFLTANGSGFTQSWGSVKWPGGIAPTLTTTNAKTDVLTFVSNDGGTTWFGFIGGQSL